ncbi:MAG: glycosyl hydrolase [Chitinophagales bacterium]
MKRGFLIVGISWILFFCGEKKIYAQKGAADNYERLREGFLNPPVAARPKVYWWWLNGNTDTVRLKEELLAMKAAGIGGADIFEIGVPNGDSLIPAGPAFMSKRSLESIRFAVKEATKLNIETGFNVSSSWNAGGSWTLPQYAAKSLYYSTLRWKDSISHKIKLPFPTIEKRDKKGKSLIPSGPDGKPVYYEEVAVLAMRMNSEKRKLDTTNIIDLSASFDPATEMVDWEAPPGDWEIFRYVSSNSGEQLKLPSPHSAGPIIDHFDSAAVHAHFSYIINQLQSVLGPFNKTTLKSLYLASYEATGLTWTSSLPTEFKKLNGYDLHKFIPALFDPGLFRPEELERFQSDFRKTLSELMINNLYREAKKIANAYGLKINCEAGGPGEPLHHVPVEPLKALGSLDIPRGEFWNRHYYYNQDSIDILRVVKEISAASHIYNRGIVEEESFTSFRNWQEGPFDLKPLADRAFCEGMNKVVIHGFSHNPPGTGFPGNVYHAGTHFNDKRVWWPMIKPFTTYLARVSYLLQQTHFTADVVYYYGDEIPNYVAPKNTRFQVGQGYDYEVINSDILLNELQVKDGFLILPGGARFKLLVLANMNFTNLAILTKLRLLLQQGAVITGPKPDGIPALYHTEAEYKLIRDMSEQLWSATNRLHQSKVWQKGKIADIAPLTMLKQLEIPPDFSCSDSAAVTLDYIHTQQHGFDFYMIRNTTDQWISRNCLFRQQEKCPEIWNPVSGDIVPVSVYSTHGQQIKIPITLPPYGSLFILFRKKEAGFHYDGITSTNGKVPMIEFTKSGLQFLENGHFNLQSETGTKQTDNEIKIWNIEGSWNLSFPGGWGAPETAIFPKLISWTKSENEGIRYFSGIVTYSKIFDFANDIPKVSGSSLYLDLGDLSEVAEVWLNHRRLGITWTKPHRFDISGIIQNGKNSLEIKVANTWSNRLTGDALTGEKYTKTNISFSSDKLRWAQTPLMESGLLGPITIRGVSSEFIK